jgi:hypothetical protein
MAWSYCLANADAPVYACVPSHLYGSPAQEPYSPSLGSSQSLEPPKHRPEHHSIQSRDIPLLLISVNFMQGIVRQLSELGDILIHRHGPLF